MRSAAPIFTVRDVVRSVEFYKEALGATGKGAFPPGPWGYVTHGELELYGQKLMFTPDKAPPGSERLPWRLRAVEGPGVRGAGIALQITLDQGEDIDAFCEQVRTKGGKIVTPPQDFVWGSRLFTIEDPDGYLIYVSTSPRRRE